MSKEEKKEKMNKYRKDHLDKYREYQKRYLEKKKKEGNLPPSHYSVLKDRIEELEAELEQVKEEFENYKQDVADNYRPVSVAEQIGYSEGW